MKEKIYAQLTEKFSGVRKDGLKALAGFCALQCGDKEETAQALVDGLTLDAVTDFIKDFRSGVDTEVANSVKVIEANYKKKLEAFKTTSTQVEKKQEQNVEPSPAPTEQDSKYSEMDAQIKALTEKLTAMQTQNIYQAREKLLLEKLDKAPQYLRDEIVDNFSNRTFNTDEDFNAFVDAKTKAVEVAIQNQIDTDLRGDFGRPLVGNVKDPDETMPPSMIAWMAEQNGTAPRAGKAI